MLIPQFSAFLPFLCCIFAITTSGQLPLDAGVKFATEFNNKAGDTSIYRFTIKVPSEGDLIRTIFPGTVAYVGDPSSVSICREADFFGNTIEI